MIIGSDHRVKENNTDCPLLLESRQYLGVQFHIRAQHMHPFLNSNLKIFSTSKAYNSNTHKRIQKSITFTQSIAC